MVCALCLFRAKHFYKTARSLSELIHKSNHLEVIENPVHSGNYVSDHINSRIIKAREAYADLNYIWSLRILSLAVKSGVYMLVRVVLLYACET